MDRDTLSACVELTSRAVLPPAPVRLSRFQWATLESPPKRRLVQSKARNFSDVLSNLTRRLSKVPVQTQTQQRLLSSQTMPPPSLPGSSGPISILALETRTDVLLALAIKRQSSSCLTLHPFGHVLNLGEFGLDWPTDRTKEDSYVVSVLGSYVRLKKKKGKDTSEIAAKLDVLERALVAQKVRLRSTPSLPPP